MLDVFLVGPIVGIMSAADVLLHLYLDVKKLNDRPSYMREPLVRVGRLTLFTVGFPTLLCFAIVFLISVAGPLSLTDTVIATMLPIADPPVYVWLPGLGLLSAGIILHAWSRWARKNNASSWEMREDQQLVKDGPYSRVRHPSYTSYMLSFVGLLLMIPSVATIMLLVGLPGYYFVSLVEEQHLIHHFGDDYENYVLETGRFLPVFRRRRRMRS